MNFDEIVIEKNVPVPPRSKWHYLVERMDSGDSVLLTSAQTQTLKAAAKKYDVKIIVRTDPTYPNKRRAWIIKTSTTDNDQTKP